MSGPGILPIVECGDPVLRRPADPVDPADLRTSELRLVIARMRATMEAAPGVGLAAPQVGVPVQLVVLRDGPERWGQLTEDERMARERYDLPFTVLANPALQPAGDGEQVSFYEGCLSVPGLTGWWPVTAPCGSKRSTNTASPSTESSPGGRPESCSTKSTTSAAACPS